MAGEAIWPLKREQQELVVMLASMLRRFGTERFLSAPLVRADARDFPDTWAATRHAVHQLIYRLCWHAYIDPEIAIEDTRAPHDPVGALTTSEIALVSCEAGVATFALSAIGNDDVAGLLSHEVGELFLELAPGEPFRSTPREPDKREASVAAIFLGLGIPAANSSMYRRHRAYIVGREERSEQRIENAGGLDVSEATLLLAIQDLLRDEVQPALKTLHRPQQEWVEDWKNVLDPHEDALREMLGLDEALVAKPLSRPAAPRTAPAFDETERKQFNRGREVKRLRQRSLLALAPGAFVGTLAVGMLKSAGFGLVGLPLAGAVLIGAGLRWCRAYFICAEPYCNRVIPDAAKICSGCGGTVGAVTTRRELVAHFRALREAEDERDLLIDPSEFAGDPDAALRSATRSRR